MKAEHISFGSRIGSKNLQNHSFFNNKAKQITNRDGERAA
jgi:hypothetical protein